MKFNSILDELNKELETKLILDDVSFFKMENILEINLLSYETVDIENTKAMLNNLLEDFGINIELNITSLNEIMEYFSNIFPSMKCKISEDKLFIECNDLREEKFCRQNDAFKRFKNKIDKFMFNIEFRQLEIDEEDQEKLKDLEIKRANKIKEEIENIKEQSKIKEVKAVQVEKIQGDFTYGSMRNAPKDLSDISDLNQDEERVLIKGTVYDIQSRKITSSTIVTFDLDDGYQAIRCKMFVRDNQIEDFTDNFKNGIEIKAYGVYRYDEYDKAMNLNVSAIEEIHLPKKLDLADTKRIEMNIHSKYTNLESIVDVEELFQRLKDFGHKSVGITDLFNVQSYPEMYKYAKKSNIKLNLGIQMNLVENYPALLTNYYDIDIKNKDIVVFDIETTGLSKYNDKIIEIGGVKVRDGKIIDTYQSFVNPQMPISSFISELTSITNDMVANADTIDKVLPDFLEFSKDCLFVAHNADFDMGFIIAKSNELNLSVKPVYMDTLYISRALNPDFKNHKLDTLVKNYQVSLMNHHRASDDAKATAEVFIKMLNEINDKGYKLDNNINEIETRLERSNNREYQNIFYAQNKIGLKNLYKLVSKSNIDYFYREPRIPYDVYDHHKEGILAGTGNYKSKLFYLISLGFDDKVLLNEVSKFDFLVVNPLDFKDHLIKRSYVKNEDHYKQIIKKIIQLGKDTDKLVVAMGDVYYLDSKSYPYRNIIKNYPRKRSLENSGAFYLKNTQEMLREFDFLDEQVQEDIVINNSIKIDEMIENFSPIADGTFPPKIENAEKILTEESYQVARHMYGDNIPPIVEDRLKKELDSIISNGYATLYLIAKMLVKKSNDDGYLVGSRGSVGSSLAATMAEITEVNPLPPHYVCKKCKHSEFVNSDQYSTGVDLPKKECPNCGIEMHKDGFDIPFETFLGFNGDKEPDIDLNFASVYQSKIHKYTESLFGSDKVFRAGTMGTIAERTAVGMALKFKEFYPEDESIKVDYANLNRVKRKIVGVKRTTGQHAGGLIIVPEEKDIEDFTPIQYPADKKESGIITTHFDYHAIDSNLLKLDLLGHNSPTIIRLLTDMSGIDAVNIDLSDKDTMDIFSSTDKLNIKHEYSNKENGSLGIPEFGTTFVRGMLDDTKPTTFEELIRISGLSHGTDVWTGNAQELVKNGIADLKSAICTRDDIMNYLIDKGLDSKLAFDIMEQVRKGKGLKYDQIEEMKAHDVPEWYIDSCLKIQYMFPKAHAVAYVMMSYRIAYFKVHHPAYFYAVTFTNEISDFKYNDISQGLNYLTVLLASLRQEPGYANGVYYVYELAEEMFARGIEFTDIDLYESHPTNFQVIDDNTIRPPLMALDGISEAVALKIDQARGGGNFISKEDFISRTKINKTAVDSMDKIGLFNDMQETNQIDFFSI